MNYEIVPYNEYMKAFGKQSRKMVDREVLNFLIEYAEQNGFTIERKMPEKLILAEKIQQEIK